jgi:hypothetical protein
MEVKVHYIVYQVSGLIGHYICPLNWLNWLTGLLNWVKPIKPIDMGVMLEPYRGHKTRYRCPQCGKSGKFTRYIDESGEYIGEDVGRCDRETSCGYHKTPKDHFKDNPTRVERWPSRPRYVEPERPIDFLPRELMMETLRGYEQNNFYLFLRDLIGEDGSRQLMRRYNVGTSRHWPGATIFWQVDKSERVRQLKLMLYNPKTGKRMKSEDPAMKWDYISGRYREDVGGPDKSLIYGKFIQGGRFKEYNLKQCLFGESLLQGKGRVAIVESEKTCLFASHNFPDLTWIATGGSNGAGFSRPEVCRVLQGREVILFPDLGKYDDWCRKALEIQKSVSCKIIVSDLLEAHAGEMERMEGYDLADYIIANNGPQNGNTEVHQPCREEDAILPAIPANTGQGLWSPLAGFEGF